MSVEFLGMGATNDQSDLRPRTTEVFDLEHLRRVVRVHEESGFQHLLFAYGSDSPDPLTAATAAAIVPITIMAAVVIGRVVEQNLVAVDPGVVEAARAAGARRLSVLFGVVIPEALAPLVLGYTFMFIAVVDMSAMAGYIGGGGLGNFAIIYGYQQFNQQATWATVAIIIVIVQSGQLLGNWLAGRILRR